MVAEEDGDADEANGESGGVGTDGKTGDDVGGVSGFGRFGDVTYGRVVSGGVVVGNEENDKSHQEAHEGGEVDPSGGGDLAIVGEAVGKENMSEWPEGGGGGECAEKNAEAEETGGVAASKIHGEDSEDGGENGYSTDDEGITQGGRLGLAVSTQYGEVGDKDAADQTDGVGFKNIRSHSGAVAHIVADVIGDGGGIAGVIFFELGFDFAHEVGSHIGGFGIDSASEAGKNTDEGGTESEAGEAIDCGTEPEVF